MANTYKTVPYTATTTLSAAYTCPTGKTAYVMLARATALTAATDTIDLVFRDSSAAADFYLLKNFPILPSSSVRIIEDRLVLEAGDVLKVKSATAATIDFVISVMEV